MKRRGLVWLSMLWLAVGCGGAESDPAGVLSLDDEDGEDYAAYDPTTKADGFHPPDGPLTFDGACQEGDTLTIAAVGDVLLHGRLQQQAFAADDRYISLWKGVKGLLKAADLTYANLEGPAARGVNGSGVAVQDPGARWDNVVYTSYPMFNYHPSLINDLLDSGVDVVSTANNHSLDRWALGVDRTIQALEDAGLAFTGTRQAGDTDQPWHTIVERKGFRLAFLACTDATNGIPDRKDQVRYCGEHADDIVADVRALAPQVDAVVVTPHWGVEYAASPNNNQVKFAHRLLDAGATLVLGSHPHVLEPWERYVTADGRETFVIYSLGNFVSGQKHLARQSTLLLYVGLTRTPDGKVVINGARYVPLHMTTFSDSYMSLEVIDRIGGHADSRKLTVDMFDPWNVHDPDAILDTDPQCDPTWEPPASPHPHDGWIGGSCATDDACGGAQCFTTLPDGLCSQWCDTVCPDRAGRPTTFCTDLGLDGGGICVARCTTNADCREGYGCMDVARNNDPSTVRKACVPAN